MCQFCAIDLQKQAILLGIPKYISPFIILIILTLFVAVCPCLPTLRDFDTDAYNDLIEYQFRNIVKLMSGLGMGESIQEKVLKELSANLTALMVVEN